MSGTRRKFRIWQEEPGFWRWECMMCSPPARGGRHGPEAFRKILTISMPGHMRRLYYHHRWMSGKR